MLVTAETAMSTNGRANTQRQVSASIMNADTNIAIMLPPPANPAQMPMALALSSGGKLDVMIDRVTGMIIAAPAPATTRATIIASVEVASSDPTVAMPNTVRPASSTVLRPYRSPIAPTG